MRAYTLNSVTDGEKNGDKVPTHESTIAHTNPAFDVSALSTDDVRADRSTDALEAGQVEFDDSPKKMEDKEAPPEYRQDEFEDLDEDENMNSCLKGLSSCQAGLSACFAKNKNVFYGIISAILVALYLAYFIYAMICGKLKTEDDIRLLWVTCTCVFFFIIYLIRRFTKIDSAISSCLRPVGNAISNHPTISNIVFMVIAGAIVILILVFEVGLNLKQPQNLVSLSGVVVFVLICYVTSIDMCFVKWRPVLTGLFIQFVVAFFILRTAPGFEVFKFLGNRVDEFLKHTDAGSAFLFGDNFRNHFFAFALLPVIIFFSSVVALLFYLGWIQVLICKIGWFMQVTMGTTSAESLNAAANIFIGQTEAPLLIRPYLGRMTNSEIHAVMTGGFATIAGTVLATYISFGVPAENLLTASVMSAPAALAISKLMYPEKKKSKTTSDDLVIEKTPYSNVMEALSAGASDSIVLVANIAANLIAFLAVLKFLNSTLTWCGYRACLEFDLTFEFICSYALSPISLLMGCRWEDCRKVAEIVGIKVFLNEFIAYQRLGVIKNNRLEFESLNGTMGNVTWTPNGDVQFYNGTGMQTLTGGFVEERSEFIAQYALCGFSNFGSMGIMLGAMSAMAPRKRKDMATLVCRAMIAGNVACFLTACIAGVFYEDRTPY